MKGASWAANNADTPTPQDTVALTAQLAERRKNGSPNDPEGGEMYGGGMLCWSPRREGRSPISSGLVVELTNRGDQLL